MSGPTLAGPPGAWIYRSVSRQRVERAIFLLIDDVRVGTWIVDDERERDAAVVGRRYRAREAVDVLDVPALGPCPSERLVQLVALDGPLDADERQAAHEQVAVGTARFGREQFRQRQRHDGIAR